MNADLVHHQALEAVEKENRARNRKKGKNVERKQQGGVNIGEVVWDRMFAEGSFELPPTRFMERIKAVVSEEDFQHIRKEILKTLKGEKDHICSCSYSTLTEATNKIYTMLTEILVQEVSQVIDYHIQVITQKKGEIKKKLSQIDHSTSKANAIKSS